MASIRRLFESGRIGKLSTKNRIVMSPMGLGSGGLTELDGTLSQRGIDYYVARAKGGAGLITSCAIWVSGKIETGTHALRFDETVDVAWLKKLVEAVHGYGAKLALQFTAGVGRIDNPTYVSKSPPVAPSVLPCFFNPNVMTRELTIEEIERSVQAFGSAAERASAAGVDAIELHCHGGYLFDEFITALWNRRTDKYGGDLEGRLRFPTEAIEAIKKRAGADFPRSAPEAAAD